jgi:putative nucleotidyltransferase with HDIG domain
MTGFILFLFVIILVSVLMFYLLPVSNIKKRPVKSYYSPHPNAPKPIKTGIAEAHIEVHYSDPPENFEPKDHISINKDVKDQISKTIATIDKLPSSSFKTLDILDVTTSSAQDVASIIATDPVLSGIIIKTVNSAYFNLPRKISSLATAILFLGFNNVKSIVIQQSLNKTVSKTGQRHKETMNKLWMHSSIVSTCAYHLGKNVFNNHESDLATIGLLHDIGKYFLPLMNPQNKQFDMVSMEKEEDCFGVNHALLGSMIAKHWALPDIIVDAIEFHHHPVFFPPDEIPTPFAKPAFIVCIADLIATSLEYGSGPSKIYPVNDSCLHHYGLKKGDIPLLITTDLIKEIKKASAAVKSYMSI